jgi:Domain of unknown function (DUF4440)
MRSLPTALAIAALAWLALAPSVRAEQAPLPPGPEGDLLRLEERRYRAMVDVDVAALQEILGDELRFTHANGSVDTKYVLIASLESGRLDYVSARSRDPAVRVYGDAAVVVGTGVLEVRVSSGPIMKLKNLFTAVYAKRDGAWRLVAYQSTKAPPGD